MNSKTTQNKILTNVMSVIAIIACLSITVFLWNITPKGLQVVVVNPEDKKENKIATATSACPPFIMPKTQPPPPLPTPNESDVGDKTKLTAILIEYINKLNNHYRTNNKLINDAYRTYNECLINYQLGKPLTDNGSTK